MFSRLLRFHRRSGWMSLLLLLAVLVLPPVIFRPIPRKLLVTSAVIAAFLVSAAFRRAGLANTIRVARFSDRAVIAIAVIVIAKRLLLPHLTSPWWTPVPFVAMSFALGLSFWVLSDDALEMRDWLASPLEYGKRPDRLDLLWEGRAEFGDLGKVRCKLWRFSVADEVGIGVTGPVTFAFADQERLDGLKPQEMAAAYGRWYAAEAANLTSEEGA